MTERLLLQPEAKSVAAARAWSVDRMRHVGLPGLADLTELLVSELVTNAVVHAGTPCELRIHPDGDGVCVEVRDRDPTLPAVHGHPDPMATSGRGVALVRDLADEFGMRPVASGGKAVWFVLRRPGRPVA